MSPLFLFRKIFFILIAVTFSRSVENKVMRISSNAARR